VVSRSKKDFQMNNRNGFSLLEMIMVITLLGIVAAIIAIPLFQSARGWFEATTREGITQSGRIGIERMEREIRNTARTAANAPCISAASATSITFSDLSGDLSLCNSITFSWAGLGNPIQRTGGGTFTLADDVQTLDMRYYNSNNSEIARPVAAGDLPTIRRLSIEIESTKGGETLRKYSEVYLSNMRGY